jgi:hypothetical protein
MRAVSDNASPEKIASGIPESELHTFIEHTRDTLDTLSTDRNWLRSGTLNSCHKLLMWTVASFAKNHWFLKIFLSSEGMEAAAKFYASRKMNVTPNHSVDRLILFLVLHALMTLVEEGVSKEKAFGTMEKTGLLGQFIRCIPVFPEETAGAVEVLQTCLQLVKKKLKSGTRTGDILNAVIAGKDGPINEKVKADLAKLQSLARLSNDNDNNDNQSNFLIKMCGHCEKVETQMDGAKLMKCQRCKVTYYCSKDCQVADWKIHKKRCNELGRSSGYTSLSTFKTSQTTMVAFIKSNYFDIAKEVYKKTQEYNVNKKELLVEMDFYEDAPALRNEFMVWLTSAFFEESALVNLPHTNVSSKTVTEAYEREDVTSDEFLCVCKAANGTLNICYLGLPRAGYQYLSDEAVESIGREDYVRMVACLGQQTTDEYFVEKRSGLV